MTRLTALKGQITLILAAAWRVLCCVGRFVDDFLVDVATALVDGFTGAIKMVVVGAASGWRFVRENARKLIPSRPVRWTVLYVPGFTIGLLFALKAFGGLDDLVAYVFEAGSRSVPVLIAIAITYAVATGLGWNLDNKERARYQRILSGTCNADDVASGADMGDPHGAFAILAGEMLSILALLIVTLAAMLVFQ